MNKIDVNQMFSESASLPVEVPEFNYGVVGASASDVLKGSGLSPACKRLVESFKPLIEAADIENAMPGSKQRTKAYEGQVALNMAAALTRVWKTNPQQWHKEATLAGTDIPTFTRQVIATIQRAYPRLFTMQLFVTTPLNGPTGRIYFRTFKYDSAFSAPNPISSGDPTNNLSNFNTDYVQTDQGELAKGFRYSREHMDVSVTSYRVASDWTYEAENDDSDQFGGNVESEITQHMSQMLMWTTDRLMIDAALADANSSQTWDYNPASYSSWTPDQQMAYNQTIWGEGILKLINKVQQKRHYEIVPDWMVVGIDLAEQIQKVSTFVPVGRQPDMSMSIGAFQDVGTLSALGIRIMVDPQLSAKKGVLGFKPASRSVPCIHYCPQRAIGFSERIDDPRYGKYVKGAYTRFAIARKSGDSTAADAQLGDLYGVFEIN